MQNEASVTQLSQQQLKQNALAEKRRNLEFRILLTSVIKEAQSAVEDDSRTDHNFSDHGEFNQDVRRMYRGMRGKLTNRQMAYVIAKAKLECEGKATDSGNLLDSAISDSKYALFVRHILTLYVNSFGLRYALTELHEWRKDLHARSHGAEIAGQICNNIIQPRETQKTEKAESLASKTIMREWNAAQVTASIKLSVKHFIQRMILADDKNAEIVDIHVKVKRLPKETRINHLVREDVADVLRASFQDLSEEAQQVLVLYFDTANAWLFEDSKTFLRAVQNLKGITGFTTYKLKKLGKEILDLSRTVLHADIKRKKIKVLVIKDKTERSKMRKGLYKIGYANQPLAIETATVDHCVCRDLDHNDIHALYDYVSSGGTIISEDVARLKEPENETER